MFIFSGCSTDREQRDSPSRPVRPSGIQEGGGTGQLDRARTDGSVGKRPSVRIRPLRSHTIAATDGNESH